jgi:hypothetical protein
MFASESSNLAGVTHKARSSDRAFFVVLAPSNPPTPHPSPRSGLAAHSRRASPYGLALPRRLPSSPSWWCGLEQRGCAPLPLFRWLILQPNYTSIRPRGVSNGRAIREAFASSRKLAENARADFAPLGAGSPLS